MNYPIKQVLSVNNSFANLSIRLSAGQILNRNDTDISCLECQLFPSMVVNQFVCNNTACSSYRNYLNYLNCSVIPGDLVKLYAQQEGLLLEDAYCDLQEKFKIKTSEKYSELSDIKNSGWYQIKNIKKQNLLTHDQINYIPFLGATNNLLGCVIIERTSENQKLIYTRTAWSFGSSQTEYLFDLPFVKPYPLFNWNLIVNNPTVPIYLSDSVELAHWNSLHNHQGIIWTAWLGGSETALDVRWDILHGRKVTYVLMQHSGLSMKEIYKTALTASTKLKDVSAIELDYYECNPRNVKGGNYPEFNYHG